VVVVSVVFVIGVVNVLLGFGLAVLLEYLQARQLAARRAPASQAPAPSPRPNTPAMPATPATPATAAAPVAKDVTSQLPGDWVETLDAEEVDVHSFVEASMQVLRLEVCRYREQLVDIEQRVRRCSQTGDTELLDRLLMELDSVNESWMVKQSKAADHLSGRRGELGEFEEAGGSLEDVLLDQAAQVETTCSNIKLLDFQSDVGVGCRRLLTEICRLTDLAHMLRDRMHDSLLTIMRAEDRIEEIDPALHVDPLTQLLSRAGLEMVFHGWWQDARSRDRTASVVLVDVDRLDKLNERLGTALGDRVLAAVGTLLNDLVRKDRGYDRVGRLGGGSFLLFLGDTGPRAGTSAAERIRQNFEATRFELGGENLEVAITCAVTELGRKDSSQSLIKRLRKVLRHAKKAGRNRTMIDEGDGPRDVEAPQYHVMQRIVQIDPGDCVLPQVKTNADAVLPAPIEGDPVAEDWSTVTMTP
jgi:diguanylate cyclase (GGDEF)-like protein